MSSASYIAFAMPIEIRRHEFCTTPGIFVKLALVHPAAHFFLTLIYSGFVSTNLKPRETKFYVSNRRSNNRCASFRASAGSGQVTD